MVAGPRADGLRRPVVEWHAQPGGWPKYSAERAAAETYIDVGREVLAEPAVTAYPVTWVRAGPPAAAIREPRQARKGAAVTVIPGAGVWLARILRHLEKDH